MVFSLQDWRDALRTKWKAWSDDPRGMLRYLGAHSLYYAVAAAALHPVAILIAQGDPRAAGALLTLGAGVGANLIANIIHQGLDEGATARELAAAAEKEQEVRVALDTILQRLDAIPEITATMNPSNREWFQSKLAAESPALAGVIIVNPGSGAVAIGGSAAAGRAA